MKSIKIKNKDYVMVNERIKEFRTNEKYKGYKLVSDLVSLNENECTMKALVIDECNNVVATGFAHEVKDNPQSMVNKTSYVENCETSAWGRALANLGIGIDTSIASAEEVVTAMTQQLEDEYINKTERFYLFSFFKNGEVLDKEKAMEFLTKYGYANTTEIIRKDYKKMIKELEKPVEPTEINEVEL